MINWTKWHELKKPWDKVIRIWVDGWSIGPPNNGDLCYNTARGYIELDLKKSDSRWATVHITLSEIFACLTSGKRWPDYMVFAIGKPIRDQQKNVTRDLWIMACSCAVHYGRYDLLRFYPPPFKWGPYREWFKALRDKKNYYWAWRWLPLFILVRHTYVFWGYMEDAYKKIKSK